MAIPPAVAVLSTAGGHCFTIVLTGLRTAVDSWSVAARLTFPQMWARCRPAQALHSPSDMVCVVDMNVTFLGSVIRLPGNNNNNNIIPTYN